MTSKFIAVKINFNEEKERNGKSIKNNKMILKKVIKESPIFQSQYSLISSNKVFFFFFLYGGRKCEEGCVILNSGVQI